MAELLPCPFCGGVGTLHSIDMCETLYAVCMNCGIRTIDYKHAEQAIRKWNTRTPKERGGEKMTDNEIIKDFEKLTKYSGFTKKVEKLLHDVIDLIKHQKAEIERLKEIANPKCQKCVSRTIECAKSEAIKEFAERLKKKYRSWEDNHGNWIQYIELDYIDNLVKEMVGDSNAD